MHSTRLQQQGFTLLEVMVTLAIVAVVAVFAMPSMNSILGGSEISATSNQLVYSLQSARSEAIKRITSVGLCPSDDPLAEAPTCGSDYNKGWIVYVDQDGNGARNGSELVILQNKALPPAFSVTPDTLYNNGVLFSISGTSVNAAGVPISGKIAISHAGMEQKRAVGITASGRIETSIPVNEDDAPKIGSALPLAEIYE